MSRRSRRERRKGKKVYEQPEVQETVVKKPKEEGSIYKRKYKLLLLIPAIMLILAIIQIGLQTAITGDFVNKGVSLKGGVTITVPAEKDIDIDALRLDLLETFPDAEIGLRLLTRLGTSVGLIVESDLRAVDEVTTLVNLVESKTGVDKSNYAVETIEPSLGSSFFRETFTAILFAFLFMGIVVFLYFRTLVPSAAVILAAMSDMIVTLAIINVLGIKLTTAGIAAFLMLIGYSVDTDILLSTRVLKREEGTVYQRVLGAMKTGMTMTITTLVAVSMALIVTDSLVLKQIMTILIIGLLVDIINTWIQNAGILRWYMEKKNG